jgi:hypothetical protein
MTLQMASVDLLLVWMTARTCIDLYLDQAFPSEALCSRVDEVEAAAAFVDECALGQKCSPSLTASHAACITGSDACAKLH